MKPLFHFAGKNGKSRKLIGVNFAVLALLVVNSGFTLTACQQLKPEGESTEKLKEEPPAKSDQKTSDEKLKKEPPAKSDKKTSDQNKGKEQDTQVDDDPE
jgi:hypothetical protein